MASLSWRSVLAPGPARHVLLLHETPLFHHSVVAAWTADALTGGDGALLIGREASRDAILRDLRLLGIDVAHHLASGRLVTSDAEPAIDDAIRDGHVDRARFLSTVRSTLAGIRRACGRSSAEVRIWGEMVDVLCCRGDPALARELEPLGDDILREERAQILCSYDQANLPQWREAWPPHDALLIESARDARATATRLVRELFGEMAVSDPMALLLGRGAQTVGTPTRAFYVPLPRDRA